MTHPSNFSEEKLAELARTKRTTDSAFRKIKLAFEGPPPKKAVPQKKKDDMKDDNKTPNGKVDDKEDAKDKPFKPTVTKKQFVSNLCDEHTMLLFSIIF